MYVLFRAFESEQLNLGLNREHCIASAMGEIDRDGHPDLLKFLRQIWKRREKSGKVEIYPTFPGVLT